MRLKITVEAIGAAGGQGTTQESELLDGMDPDEVIQQVMKAATEEIQNLKSWYRMNGGQRQ